jgi:hypothetical protein
MVRDRQVLATAGLSQDHMVAVVTLVNPAVPLRYPPDITPADSAQLAHRLTHGNGNRWSQRGCFDAEIPAFFHSILEDLLNPLSHELRSFFERLKTLFTGNFIPAAHGFLHVPKRLGPSLALANGAGHRRAGDTYPVRIRVRRQNDGVGLHAQDCSTERCRFSAQLTFQGRQEVIDGHAQSGDDVLMVPDEVRGGQELADCA